MRQSGRRFIFVCDPAVPTRSYVKDRRSPRAHTLPPGGGTAAPKTVPPAPYCHANTGLKPLPGCRVNAERRRGRRG